MYQVSFFFFFSVLLRFPSGTAHALWIYLRWFLILTHYHLWNFYFNYIILRSKFCHRTVQKGVWIVTKILKTGLGRLMEGVLPITPCILGRGRCTRFLSSCWGWLVDKSLQFSRTNIRYVILIFFRNTSIRDFDYHQPSKGPWDLV